MEELAAIHWEAWLLTGDGREPDPEVIAVVNALAARGLKAGDLLSLGDGDKWESVGGALSAFGIPEVQNRHKGRQRVAMALVATRRLLAGTDVREIAKLLPRSAKEREAVLKRMPPEGRGVARRALEVLEHVVSEIVEAGGLPQGRSDRSKLVRELVNFIKDETQDPSTLRAAFQAAGSLRELVEGPLANEAVRRIAKAEEAKRAAEEAAKTRAVVAEVEPLTDEEREVVELAKEDREAALDRIFELGLNGDRDEGEVLMELEQRAAALEDMLIIHIEVFSDEERAVLQAYDPDNPARALRMLRKMTNIADREALEAALQSLLERAKATPVEEPEPAAEPDYTPIVERVVNQLRRLIRSSLMTGDNDIAETLKVAIEEAGKEAGIPPGEASRLADEALETEWAVLVAEVRQLLEVAEALGAGDPDGAILALEDSGWADEVADELVEGWLEEAVEAAAPPAVEVIDYGPVMEHVFEGKPLPSVGEPTLVDRFVERETELATKSLKGLRRLAMQHGLSDQGSREELVQRILDHEFPEEPEAQPEPVPTGDTAPASPPTVPPVVTETPVEATQEEVAPATEVPPTASAGTDKPAVEKDEIVPGSDTGKSVQIRRDGKVITLKGGAYKSWRRSR